MPIVTQSTPRKPRLCGRAELNEPVHWLKRCEGLFSQAQTTEMACRVLLFYANPGSLGGSWWEGAGWRDLEGQRPYLSHARLSVHGLQLVIVF